MSMNQRADDGVAPANTTSHPGYGTPSDTVNGRDQGTDWPADTFTGLVNGPHAGQAFTPADHSYDQDGNMEAYEIAGPYVAGNESSTDVGQFTGAVGPSGRMTSPDHPEGSAP